LYALLTSGNLFSRASLNSNWIQIDSNVSSFQLSSTGFLYVLVPGGNVDVWKNGTWQLVAGNVNSFQVAPNGTLYLLQTAAISTDFSYGPA